MDALLSNSLLSDPRIVEAKRLALAAVADQQRRITGLRPPDPARQAAYAEALKQFADLRAGALYYPYLGSGAGNGPFVELADGSVKYDMICGIGVHFLGHAHPALVAAELDAALQDTVMQGNLQQNVESFEVTKTLIDL